MDRACRAARTSATGWRASCSACTTARRSATSLAPQYRRSTWGFSCRTPGRSRATSPSTTASATICNSPIANSGIAPAPSTRSVVNPNANGLPGRRPVCGQRTRPLQLHAGPDLSLRDRAAARLRLSYRVEDRAPRRLGRQLRPGVAVQLHRRRQQPGHGLQHAQFPGGRQRRGAGKISPPLNYTLSGAQCRELRSRLLVAPGATVQNAPATVDPNGDGLRAPCSGT